MRHAILLSSPDPRCFFLPHPPHDVMLSCARSRLFNVPFFHVALFFIFVFFLQRYNENQSSSFSLSDICSTIRNTRFESGRRVPYISPVRCKSCPFIFACESRRCVLDVPTLSHLSLYTLVLLSAPLLFSSTSPSLFRPSGERAWCVWPDGIFPLYFPNPVQGYQIPSFLLLPLRCISRAHSYLLVFSRTVG